MVDSDLQEFNMKQLEFRFYDLHPEQLELPLVYESASTPINTFSISDFTYSGALTLSSTYPSINKMTLYTSGFDLVLTEHPNVLRRLMYKMLGVEWRVENK